MAALEDLATLGEVKTIIRMVKTSPFIMGKKINGQVREAGAKFCPREDEGDPPEG